MYPAHIRETGERQTVREHCRNTAALAATALRPLGLEKSAYLAGLLHDAGKNKQEYEDYLLEAAAGGSVVRGSVNHTFAGVRFLLDRWHCGEGDLSYSDVTAELLAFAIGSHHGLFDCVDPQQHSGFFHRQTKEGIFYDESRQGFLAEVADEEELEHLFRDAVREMAPMLDRLAALSTQADDNEADRETAFYIGLLARMLLSAVIEGDRTDTAAFMDDLKPPSFPEDMRPIWAGRLAFMEKKLAAFPRKTPIDLVRHTISDTCAAGAARPGGVYRLNVPTGGGKTLASLRFALTHAAKRNCSRIIFTAPLLSILDQNAQVIRDYIGDDTLILEHHSNLAEPKETPERLQSALDKPSADNRQKVVCVSTQVIEAGVDISFQRVIRFSAGMDSVVQAAGRCNRHAEQKEPAPVRLIRCTDERLRGLDDIVRGQNATTALLTAFSQTPEVFRHDLSSEEAIRFYYRRLYAEMEPGFQDDQTPAHGSLYHLLADNPRYADANCKQGQRYFLRQAFRLAGGLFQVFDEDTGALLVPYGRGRELQNTLRNAAQVYGQKDWAVIRGCIDEAKGYCVSVYRYQLERLEALGAVTSLFDGGVLLLSDGFYNEHTGFSLEAGTRDFQEV